MICLDDRACGWCDLNQGTIDIPEVPPQEATKETPKVACTAYPLNGCAHPQFCREGCAGRPLRYTSLDSPEPSLTLGYLQHLEARVAVLEAAIRGR